MKYEGGSMRNEGKENHFKDEKFGGIKKEWPEAGEERLSGTI
jgi:hypothetical protein